MARNMIQYMNLGEDSPVNFMDSEAPLYDSSEIAGIISP